MHIPNIQKSEVPIAGRHKHVCDICPTSQLITIQPKKGLNTCKTEPAAEDVLMSYDQCN
jgi:hypothetical protein